MDVRDEKSDALAGAAVAAVAGALAYGLKKALADSPAPATGLAEHGKPQEWSRVQVALDSLPDMLLPLIDNAAGAAGRWVADNSPDLIRDRLLPRFIGAFTDAASARRS